MKNDCGFTPRSGLIAATFTPLTETGKLDVSVIPQMVDYLVGHNISSIYVLGSTGEGVSLTADERLHAAEAFVDACVGRLPVIVQVGCESLVQARQLAAHAQKIGADAISAVCPVYFKPDSVQTLVDSMAEIAMGAPQLPFYYYHIPAATGAGYSMLDFLRIAGVQIPTLRGIKYTSTDVKEFQACVEFAADKFELFWGVDEMLLDGLKAGAVAAIGSTYNFAAPIYQRLLAHFRAGDLDAARREQKFSQAVVDAFVKFGSRAAQKAIMAMVGPDCGPPRLPLKSLGPAQVAALRESLESVGFFKQIASPSTQLEGAHFLSKRTADLLDAPVATGPKLAGKQRVNPHGISQSADASQNGHRGSTERDHRFDRKAEEDGLGMAAR